MADAIIQSASDELKEALDLLQTNGYTALALARNRSDHLGEQSNQISEISREARTYVDELEDAAKKNKANAEEAIEKASKAYNIAKNAINLQQNITDDIKTNIPSELAQAETKLESVSKLTSEALDKANEIYDDALSLLADVNEQATPTINIDKIKKESSNYLGQAEEIGGALDEAIEKNNKLVSELEENVKLGEALLDR